MGVVPLEQRYSVITEKNPREIVLLRGSGCGWRKCRFCDYHLDFHSDQEENRKLNHQILSQVTGSHRCLEVINSGSFTELPAATVDELLTLCINRHITQLHFESHWKYRAEIPAVRERFLQQGITVKLKTGIETFDTLFRESYLEKGIDEDRPSEIARYFDEVCLLQGIPGQTEASMKQDIETGLAFFERVCVNVMTANTKPIRPDPAVIRQFMREVYPLYKDNSRVDILLNNTDWGVGTA